MGFTLPSDNPKERARELISRKENIEAEIKAQMSILTTNGCTMRSPLVDPEGFPRADIDIFAVRGARVRIIELRNDLEAITNEIGKVLEQVYDPVLFKSVERSEPGPSHGQLTPFAKVDSVAPGSPAAEAGLQREDLIVKFGLLTRSSFTSVSLQPIAELVSTSENQHLPIMVNRSGQTIVLTLTPRKGWGGQGMLGCHVVPYLLSS